MIRWIFFSTLAMGIFYALYCLLLKRDRWLMLSRWYLLITLVFSILVPLVRMPASVTDNRDDLPTVVSIELPAVGAASSDVVVQRAEICRWIYLTGLIVMVTILLVRLWRLLSYLREQTFVKCGELRLSLTEDNMPPFSFFKWVVVGTQGLSSEEMECVLAHEELHVRQCHSADILLVRALCCLAWFNPLAWMMLRELQSVHEYLADNAVMQHHGGKGYIMGREQMLLIAENETIKFHRGNKQYPMPSDAQMEFDILDSVISKTRIILLVQIGKEEILLHCLLAPKDIVKRSVLLLIQIFFLI